MQGFLIGSLQIEPSKLHYLQIVAQRVMLRTHARNCAGICDAASGEGVGIDLVRAPSPVALDARRPLSMGEVMLEMARR